MIRQILHGIAVSAGIAIGRAYFLARQDEKAMVRRKIPVDGVEQEITRLMRALESTRREMEETARRIPPELKDQAGIIAAHLMICRDPKLVQTALNHVRERHFSAEWALREAVADIARAFSLIDDVYIRERVQDVRAVADRVTGHLQGRVAARLPEGEACILLARDLTPADTLELSPKRFCSFATEEGGRTAHTGILARSLQIPAVVGVSGLEESVSDGDLVVVDGLKGLLLVNPEQKILAAYEAMQHSFTAFQEQIRLRSSLPAEMPDGVRIAVRGNIETPDEAEAVTAAGGEGIGLYRTEFGFISRTSVPKEEELYEEYAALASKMAPHKVTLRTLDVGADKMLWAQRALEEANPALGLRAIRYCLRHQDIFRSQLRAILRASVHGSIALMFPMISGLRELRQAKAVLNEVKQELETSLVPFDRNTPLGIMIELPSAVMTADALAREVDFFSIGTNDLIQYSLGIDRGNRHVSHLYQPLHPAVVRSIKHVADMAHKEGIPVSVCGEMASDPYCLPILLGMGIDEVSMAPQAIPGIKHIIRNIDLDECRELLYQAHSAATSETVNRILKQALSRRFPRELPFYVSMLDAEE